MVPRARLALSVLLLLSIAGVFASANQASAQFIVLSRSTHAVNQSGPSQASTTSTTHGRHGQGVPPGLLKAWAHSNMSVVARAVTHAIFLNGIHGVELAWIAIDASSNGQMIQNVAFNESAIQVKFDHDGAVHLSANSSAKPTAVFADDAELTQASSALTPGNEGWLYNQTSHVLTVFADPSSITIFYGSALTPIPEFPAAILNMLMVSAFIAAASAMFLSRRRITR